MHERDLSAALDACQPDGDELRWPEMAEVADVVAHDPHWQQVRERVRRCDRLIGTAFRAVPVPDGLDARLLAALAPAGMVATAAREPDTAAAGEGSPQVASDPEAAVKPVALPASPGPRAARRRIRLWGGVSGLATAAAVLLVAALLRWSQAPLPELGEEFAKEVIAWSETVREGPWSEDMAAPQLAGYPLDPAIRAAARRWACLATRYDAQTVVYDLAPSSRSFALMFCLRTGNRVSSLPGLPPPTPCSTTGGVAIGAWESHGLVYVLTVQGGPQRYQSFLNARWLIGLNSSGAGAACPGRKV